MNAQTSVIDKLENMFKATTPPEALAKAVAGSESLKATLSTLGVPGLNADQAYGFLLGATIAHDLGTPHQVEVEGQQDRADVILVPMTLFQAMVTLGLAEFRAAETRDESPAPGFYL